MGQPSVARVDTYDFGDIVRSPATFVGTDLVTPGDPDIVQFFTRDPAGGIACYQYGAAGASIARLAAGAYYKDWTPATYYGEWWYRYLGTGGIQAADEWQIIVARSQFIH